MSTLFDFIKSISASKFVFILMAVGSVYLTVIHVMDVKDFLILSSMAFSFYFANKGDTTKPFAGK